MDEFDISDFKRLYEEAKGLTALDQLEWDSDYFDYYFEEWDDDELDFALESELRSKSAEVDLTDYIPKRIAQDADYYDTFKVRGCWLDYGRYLAWIEGNSLSEIVSNLHVKMLNSLIEEETRKNIHLMV